MLAATGGGETAPQHRDWFSGVLCNSVCSLHYTQIQLVFQLQQQLFLSLAEEFGGLCPFTSSSISLTVGQLNNQPLPLQSLMIYQAISDV